MVTLHCDSCNYKCEHTSLGIKFGIEWLKSGKTKLAYCSNFSNTNCSGILQSGLSSNEVENMTQITLKSNYYSQIVK